MRIYVKENGEQDVNFGKINPVGINLGHINNEQKHLAVLQGVKRMNSLKEKETITPEDYQACIANAIEKYGITEEQINEFLSMEDSSSETSRIS